MTWPDDSISPEPTRALLKLLPGLADHPSTTEEPGGFVAELRRAPGLPLGYVSGRIASELQRREGEAPKPVALRRPPAKQEDGAPEDGAEVQDIFFHYDDPEIGVLAGQGGVIIALGLLPPEMRPAHQYRQPIDVKQVLDNYLKTARSIALDQTALALIEEAKRRDIPWFVVERNLRVVQFGQGRHLQRIRETVTDKVSNTAALFQRDKATTNRIFSEVLLPVPRQIVVRDKESAVRAARTLGYPVVVKPARGGKGKGVSVQLEGDEAVAEAFVVARQSHPEVIVEGYIAGFDHRVLVVGGRIVAAAQRVPGAVTGGGRHTIAELVAGVNKDPRRGIGFTKLMNRLELDREALRMLEKRGYTGDSIPPKGEMVPLRGTANISTGGTAIDVTDLIHPDNRVMLERAARISGLDVAGVDFLTRDISRSYRVVGGGICEVNYSPGLRPHLVAAQTSGIERDVVGPIIERLFPGKSNGRIPIVAVTGTNGKTTTSRMTAHILRRAGGEIGVGTVGLVTTSGAEIDGQTVARGDIAGASGARVLLRDPSVEAAVLETSRGGIVKGGMAFDWCDVSAVLNIANDHLGTDGIDSLDELARIKGRVAEAARKLAVLNSDDPRCLALAELKPAQEVCLISLLPAGAVLLDHVAKGGLAISLDGNNDAPGILLHRPGASDPVIKVGGIPATLDGAAKHNVQNAMAAIGLAYGLGISLPGIAAALASYDNTFDSNPGRFNIYEGHPFTAVLDMAHNPHGVLAACEALKTMEAPGRRIGLLANFGNRHAEHIAETAQILAGQFDTFICSRDKWYSEAFKSIRGFPSEEIPKRIAAALVAQGVESSRIITIDDEVAAIDKALGLGGEGDLVVFFSGDSERCWQRIVDYRKAEKAESA
ncbi:Mur ligase family protein [Pelagibius marinus]|uniref:Mur ligase family protein n=1 Tax=Pelagibius marinus TaxID=2762760 RepID=UPI0018730BE3|nr:Mur ligase family protein [Pelagibius marinus]